MADGPENLPAPDDEDAELEASRAPLLDHLIELRRRIIICVVAIGLGFILSFILA
ncbi:MAG: twin-arginine translocase subunit TatC, partial [Caulobacterales bacterium]|nr:twin-arginine translocase subunit TatC [Caulobacterales bacterium]